MHRNSIPKYIFITLIITLLLISNYYYVSFPTILDTFSYLLASSQYTIDLYKNTDIHYIPFKLITGNIDSILLNTLLTYLGFLAFLITTYLGLKTIFNGKGDYILFFLIFTIFLFGNYRFFIGGFMQIIIFTGLALSLFLQIKFDESNLKGYLAIKYIYLIFLATINDFGILLLIFNILYNFSSLIFRKKALFLLITGIISWMILYYLVHNNILLIEYPTDGKLKLLYNIFFNPFTWGPGLGFFNQFKLLFGEGFYGYLFLGIFFVSCFFYKGKGKSYLIGFIIFYALILLLLPKAPSFNRYISYFYLYVGILLSSLILLKKIHNYKFMIFFTVSMLFIVSISSSKIYNFNIQWNKDGRYGLDYNLGKDYICSNYPSEKIYGYFSASFILGYSNGGCDINNLFRIDYDFYNGINPIKTIINNNIKLFYYSKLTDIFYAFDEYLLSYTKQIGISYTKIDIVNKVFTNLSNGFLNASNKVNLYSLSYPNMQIEDVPVENDRLVINRDASYLFMKLYITNNEDNLYIKSEGGEKLLSISNLFPYNKRDWNNIFIVINLNDLPTKDGIILDEGILQEAQFLYK